jgi:hypothetical protein
MYATVRFRSHRATPPLLVRGDALMPSASGITAAVLQDAGQGNGQKKVHLQRVQVGRDYGVETEITSGLRQGDTVVINPGDEVREGAIVTAVKATAQGAPGASGGSGAGR